MRLISVNPSSAQLEMSEQDLIVIANALNEVINGIDLFEFDTRISVHRPVVKAMQAEIGQIVGAIGRTKGTNELP